MIDFNSKAKTVTLSRNSNGTVSTRTGVPGNGSLTYNVKLTMPKQEMTYTCQLSKSVFTDTQVVQKFSDGHTGDTTPSMLTMNLNCPNCGASRAAMDHS